MDSTKKAQADQVQGSVDPCIVDLDPSTRGAITRIENIVTMTVSSKDDLVLRAEYKAGFVQGRLQEHQSKELQKEPKEPMISWARDNSWNNAYLTDPSHGFPAKLGPSKKELERAQGILVANLEYFLEKASAFAPFAENLKRLLYRMIGIYHGASRVDPDYSGLDFKPGGPWPAIEYFEAEELVLTYEAEKPTFLDIYFINAFNDLMDVISSSPELCVNGLRVGDYPDFCSAFIRRVGDEIIIAHNSWMGFLSQTMCQTIRVNESMHTENAATPGLIGSGTDFGYNNNGILYNETTHRFNKTITKTEGLWIFWRAAMAEQFSSKIEDFFNMISVDNTGTYLNGYMVADAKNGKSGLVEMSYRYFIYYLQGGKDYVVSYKSMDGSVPSLDYDREMVTPDYLMGINYPASLQVREDLQSTDNRPARRRQFKMLLPKIVDLSSAHMAITYTDPENPLSIFGRWDLGYGETNYPKRIPDGSVDAKVASTVMAREFMKLSGELDIRSPIKGLYMLYGTPYVEREPFVWSKSSWHLEKLRGVPDRLDGIFTRLPLYLKQGDDTTATKGDER